MKPILHQAIRIQLKPSYLILGLLIVISIACSLILLVLPLMLMFKLAIFLCVIASSIYFSLRDALLMLPNSWQFLDIDTKGQLTISNQSKQAFKPVLADSSFIHNRMVLLNFKSSGFKLALPPIILITTHDNANNLRRLRVWLRWGKPANQAQEDLLEGLAEEDLIEVKG